MDNGNPTVEQLVLSQAIERIRNGNAGADERMLVDMHGEYPALRLHLLGCSNPETIVHSGSISFVRNEKYVEMRIHKPTLQYQAVLRGDSFFGMLETAELELREGSLEWCPDWTLKQKRRQQLMKDLT